MLLRMASVLSLTRWTRNPTLSCHDALTTGVTLRRASTALSRRRADVGVFEVERAIDGDVAGERWSARDRR